MCQFNLGCRKLLVDGFKETQVFQQLTLIAQGIQRSAQAFIFRLAGVVHRFFCLSDGAGHFSAQFLGAGCPPKGCAHVLNQQMHSLSTTLGGDQHTVTILLGGVVAEAKIEQTPSHAEIEGCVFLGAGNVRVGQRRFASP